MVSNSRENYILWGAAGSSFNLAFPKKIDCIVDEEWNNWTFFRKVKCELYWRCILKRPLRRACYSVKHLKKYNSEKDIIILGNIFNREKIIFIAEKLGYIPEKNLFEAFDLSPAYCKMQNDMVTKEEIQNKDYERDSLKLSLLCQMIPEDVQSVCDVGCGDKSMCSYMRQEIKYCGIDYICRAEDIILCDLNHEEFPEVRADCFFCCGILEFITDWKKFLNAIVVKNPKYILLSYSAREYSDYSTKRSRVYHNSIYSSEITSLICSQGYVLDEFKRYESRQVLYRFKRILNK